MNKKKIIPILYTFIITIITVIWLFSKQNGNDSDYISSQLAKLVYRILPNLVDENRSHSIQLSEMNALLRRGAHFSLFMTLGLFTNLLMLSKQVKKTWVITFFFVFVMALTDEFHQSFVRGRSSEWQDILVDMIGACLGILFSYFFWMLAKRCKQKYNIS